MAGMQTSARSWGTGRAVSRIPRVPGGGTHRSGQGAFRKHVAAAVECLLPPESGESGMSRFRVIRDVMRLFLALAASALPGLVMARGHEIDDVPEVPLVIDNGVEKFEKTAKAVTLLKSLGAYDDVERVIETRNLRAGKGKLRNRRFQQRRGPLCCVRK